MQHSFLLCGPLPYIQTLLCYYSVFLLSELRLFSFYIINSFFSFLFYIADYQTLSSHFTSKFLMVLEDNLLIFWFQFDNHNAVLYKLNFSNKNT